MLLDSDLSSLLPQHACIEPITNPIIDHWSRIRCGSYTTEWVARAIGLKPRSANSRLFGPVWFDLFRPVVPSDMRKLLKTYGMNTVEVHLKEFSDQERLQWIRHEIVVKKRPPIILIRTRILHWIAIGGYDDEREIFYIYDPGIGKDSLNLNLPIGNREISYAEILKRWRGRWWMKYVAIVVTNVGVRDLKEEKKKEVLEAYARGELVRNPLLDRKDNTFSK